MILYLLACTPDKNLDSRDTAVENIAPEVMILSPLNNDAIYGSFSVEAQITDDQTPYQDLLVRVRPGQPQWQTGLDENGYYTVHIREQTPGGLNLIVEAKDSAGAIGQSSIILGIQSPNAPNIRIREPAANGVYAPGTSIQFHATLTDNEAGPWDIVWRLEGESTIELGCDGSFSSPIDCTWDAISGDWHLSLEALDAEGLTGSASVDFHVLSDAEMDGDGDGMTVLEGDCDDADSSITSIIRYVDNDGDLYGGDPIQACTLTPGIVDVPGDCDDSDAGIYPNAPEVCDGLDQNCDRFIDNRAIDPLIWYRDGDGDGFGDANSSSYACDRPNGFIDNDTDCDDGDASISPVSADVCNLVDDDCDGSEDNDYSYQVRWYYDWDRDGYGNSLISVMTCFGLVGYVSNSSDCDDGNANLSPGATEYCNGVDDDCDGTTDEASAADVTPYYLDSDGDLYGDGGFVQWACTAPAGYVALGTDCDDADPTISPAAIEICDDIDEDCDGNGDSGIAPLWYVDSDGDGYGASNSATRICLAPAGYIATGGDCNDRDGAIHPRVTEICDGVDNNCNSMIDDNPSVGTTYYLDNDGDGYGNALVPIVACSQPSNYVANRTDCNDGNANTHPGASELCDRFDNDCDGVVDEGASGAATWYRDQDGDSYGGTATISQCAQPVGYAARGGDCDDNSAIRYPTRAESCDAIDNNCDGSVDEGLAGTFYQDSDGDGYGNVSVFQSTCAASAGYVSNANDCDDGNASIHPGAVEHCGRVDNDCDGLYNEVSSVDVLSWSLDSDGDGYGGQTSVQRCTQPAGYVTNSSDCNDSNSSINPRALEVCDVGNVDEDCDGLAEDADSSVGGRVLFYQDSDNDGVGDSAIYQFSCEVPSAYVAIGGDCDDHDDHAYPGFTEVCDDIDNDCDGEINEHARDVYEENDSYATAEYLGDINGTSVSFEVTLHELTDQDVFLWHSNDGLSNRAVSLTVQIESGTIPVSISVTDEVYSETEYAFGAGSFSISGFADSNQPRESVWYLTVVPGTQWVSTSCDTSIHITITEL